MAVLCWVRRAFGDGARAARARCFDNPLMAIARAGDRHGVKRGKGCEERGGRQRSQAAQEDATCEVGGEGGNGAACKFRLSCCVARSLSLRTPAFDRGIDLLSACIVRCK